MVAIPSPVSEGQMAKKKKAKKKSRPKSQLEILKSLLKKVGQPQIVMTSPYRGKKSFAFDLHDEDGSAYVHVRLIEKDDGSWRVKLELNDVFLDLLEDSGFRIAGRKRKLTDEEFAERTANSAMRRVRDILDW
jgi:hypothetical protein